MVALLIVDMQKACREATSCKHAFDNCVRIINMAGRYFREKNYPVVIIKDIEVASPGTAEFETVDDIAVSDRDIVIHKLYCNAFWKTELDQILKDKGVDCVIVSGFAAEYCALFTYNGAVERGYEAFLLQDGIAGFNEEEIKRIQLLRPVINLNALIYFLEVI